MPEPIKIPVSMPLSTPEPMNTNVVGTIRKRYLVKGKVQHVGYRALVRAFAETLRSGRHTVKSYRGLGGGQLRA